MLAPWSRTDAWIQIGSANAKVDTPSTYPSQVRTGKVWRGGGMINGASVGTAYADPADQAKVRVPVEHREIPMLGTLTPILAGLWKGRTGGELEKGLSTFFRVRVPLSPSTSIQPASRNLLVQLQAPRQPFVMSPFHLSSAERHNACCVVLPVPNSLGTRAPLPIYSACSSRD